MIKLNIPEKLNKWILVVGLIFLAFGLIHYSITNLWNWVNIVPGVIGLLATIFAIIQLDLPNLIKSRRFIYGGNMALAIILFIAILGLLDFILVRHTWRVDTTSSGFFSLSEQTKKVLKNLKKDVQIYAFYKDIAKSSILDQLKEYRHYSKRIKYEVIDPDAKPTIARKYKVKDYGNLVVICDEKEELVPSYSEQALTNAIIKVTRDTQKKVAFITGHGEKNINSADRDGFEQAKKAIEQQNYLVEELTLADKDSIPSEYSALVIPGPTREFFEKEKNLIEKYLSQGGGVLFMVDPRPSPGFADFLKKYYIEVGDNLIFDMSGVGRLFGATPDIPMVTNYGNHQIGRELKGHMTFFPVARSVRPIETEDYSVTVEEIALTSQHSVAVKNFEEVYRTGRLVINPNDLRGPIGVAVAMTKDSNKPDRKMRLVVVGDSDFASNAYFNTQANGDLFMNIVNWLLADEDLIAIRPKAPEIRTINMTKAQTKTVFWLTVVVLPAIAFGMAVVVYVRRR